MTFSNVLLCIELVPFLLRLYFKRFRSLRYLISVQFNQVFICLVLEYTQLGYHGNKSTITGFRQKCGKTWRFYITLSVKHTFVVVGEK